MSFKYMGRETKGRNLCSKNMRRENKRLVEENKRLVEENKELRKSLGMAEYDIAPCPFCDQLAGELIIDGAVKFVECTSCRARGPVEDNPNVAIDNWAVASETW